MPIPTLFARNHSTTAQASAFQLNMNRAATAPIWNRVIKTTVIQLSLPAWALRPSFGMSGWTATTGRAAETAGTTGLSSNSMDMGEVDSENLDWRASKMRRSLKRISGESRPDVTLLYVSRVTAVTLRSTAAMRRGHRFALRRVHRLW